MRWNHLFSVAPMMEYTDTHQRFLMRLISKRAVLYTEMVTANTLCRAVTSPEDCHRFLRADFEVENPLVLQLGGSDVAQMATAARLAKSYGYGEINLNVGCPSDKVAGKGSFGASLMLKPELVADLCQSISSSTSLPTTVKCRIGVNDQDSYESLCHFIHTVASKGEVSHFIVHARKAILNKNFSPADNRSIPPLKYDYVHALVKDFPHLRFTINGGLHHMQDLKHQLSLGVHGVMLGRAVVNDPFYYSRVDHELYGVEDTNLPSRGEVLESYIDYALRVEKKEGPRARTALAKVLYCPLYFVFRVSSYLIIFLFLNVYSLFLECLHPGQTESYFGGK